MTQLVELRDRYNIFEEAGIKLYAISYDDVEAIKQFSDAYEIPYPLLSDVDSKVIKDYGILNTQVKPGDALLYGIPYPGTYITDERGVVTEKSFFDTYKRRMSAEQMVDRAVGEVLLRSEAPRADASDDEGVKVSATLHGGVIKQGAQREIVVRFELPGGLHIYGEPVPNGMVPTTISVEGPDGLVIEDLDAPPTEELQLSSLDLNLNVWSGKVDFRVPVYATSEIASECRPVDNDVIEIRVRVAYQACDDAVCLLPREEVLIVKAPVEPVDVQSIDLHRGHGQREAPYDGMPAVRRLMARKIKAHPFGFARYMVRSAWLNIAAWRRSRGGK